MSAAKKIMFVDDDRDFLTSQSIFFSSRGYDVLTAEDDQEALKLLEEETPDVMILDLMMEHYDSGFALARKIRSVERFRDVPLIMLSGVASATGRRFDQDAAELKKWSGVDTFLDKPVTGLQLLKVIEQKTSAAK